MSLQNNSEVLCLGFEGKYCFPCWCLLIFKAGSLEFWQDVLDSIWAAEAGNGNTAPCEGQRATGGCPHQHPRGGGRAKVKFGYINLCCFLKRFSLLNLLSLLSFKYVENAPHCFYFVRCVRVFSCQLFLFRRPFPILLIRHLGLLLNLISALPPGPHEPQPPWPGPRGRCVSPQPLASRPAPAASAQSETFSRCSKPQASLIFWRSVAFLFWIVSPDS